MHLHDVTNYIKQNNTFDLLMMGLMNYLQHGLYPVL